MALALAACGGGAQEGGLRPGQPFGWHESMDVGQRFTDSMLIIQNTTGQQLEILEVTPEMTGDLTYLGAYLAGPERPENIQQTPQYPPTDPAYGPVRPAVGALLEPGELASGAGYLLLLGYQVGSDERSTRRALTVKYRQAGHVRSVTYRYTLAICVPKRPEECPPETTGW